MATCHKGGGPAFPVNGPNGDHPGMELRDWFAGQAIAGLLANPNVIAFSARAGWELVNSTPAQIADFAVHIGTQMVWASGVAKENESANSATGGA